MDLPLTDTHPKRSPQAGQIQRSVTTHYLLPTTYYPLQDGDNDLYACNTNAGFLWNNDGNGVFTKVTTDYLLLSAYRLLLTAYYWLLATGYSLLTTHYLLLTTYYLLLTN